jgi:hypothetical protein
MLDGKSRSSLTSKLPESDDISLLDLLEGIQVHDVLGVVPELFSEFLVKTVSRATPKSSRKIGLHQGTGRDS